MVLSRTLTLPEKLSLASVEVVEPVEVWVVDDPTPMAPPSVPVTLFPEISPPEKTAEPDSTKIAEPFKAAVLPEIEPSEMVTVPLPVAIAPPLLVAVLPVITPPEMTSTVPSPA